MCLDKTITKNVKKAASRDACHPCTKGHRQKGTNALHVYQIKEWIVGLKSFTPAIRTTKKKIFKSIQRAFDAHQTAS